MRWQQWLMATVVTTVASAGSSGTAYAEQASDCRHIERANLVRCATGASLARQAAGAAIDAAEGRAAATDPWFPSAPSLGLTGARRTLPGSGESAWNWSATLGVEVGLAGERGARRRAAMGEKEAETRRAEALGRRLAVE